MPNQTTQALEALREAMEAYGAGDSAVVMALCVQRAIIALESAAPSAAEPVALTEKQRRVLEHYNFAQFDADNLAKVPEAVRRDLWAMLNEMSATPEANGTKGANQCVWPDQAHEAGSHGLCVHCGAALSQGGGA